MAESAPVPLLSPGWLARFGPTLRRQATTAPRGLDSKVNVTVAPTPWGEPALLRMRARHGVMRWAPGRFRLEDAHIRMTYPLFVLCWCERSLRPAVDAVTVHRPEIRATGRIGELARLAHIPFPSDDPSVLAALGRGTLVPSPDAIRARLRTPADG